MAFIEQILKVCWPGLAEAHWISVDTCGPDIGGQILQLRMRGEDVDPTPIILYGFSSFESLARSEKAQPWLLMSSGVHYLHLPASWDRVESILNRAEGNQLNSEDLKTELMDSAFAGNALAHMESVLAHNIGNFLGPEKLLYGSHLAGMIDGDNFKNILQEIRQSQGKALENTQEYLLYRLSQINYNPQEIGAPRDQTIRGKILYIDDHAHLGWAPAVASALWGKCYHKAGPQIKRANVDNFRDRDGEVRLSVIDRGGLSSKENDFLDQALQFAANDRMLSNFDLVLLDLRLRWKEDEKTGNQEIDELSGIKVLRKIRKTNAAIPVIVLTASRKARNMEEVLDLGADAYFIKESPQPGEKDADIRDYYCRFVHVVEKTLCKSYLAEVWRSVNSLNTSELPTDVIPLLKKSIGLLKIHPNSHEQKTMHLDRVGEAVLKLGLVKEELKKSIGFQKPFLDKGFLLTGLRNFSAHLLDDTIIEDDAKIAIYLTFRLLSTDGKQLKNLADSLFSERPIEPKKYPEIVKQARKKLRELIEIKFRSGSLPKEWKITSPAEIQTMNLNDLSTLLLSYPGVDTIHKHLRNSKLAHYIMFLCRMGSRQFHHEEYIPPDHKVVGAICRLASVTV